jgi:hypothetical protein
VGDEQVAIADETECALTATGQPIVNRARLDELRFSQHFAQCLPF